MATLSSVRLPVVEPRRTMRTWVRTWVPAPARSVGFNRWTRQIPCPAALAWSVISVPVNAVLNASVVVGAVVAGSDLTGWPTLFSKPSTTAERRYSYVVPSRRPTLSGNVAAPGGTGPMGANVPTGNSRRSRMNSVATVDTLVQKRLIRSMPAAVAVRFTGVAGKTVAEEMSEGSEGGS